MYHYQRLAKLRDENNFSQTELAKLLDINQVVYSRYETGIREIPIHLLIELTKIYDCSIDYIVGISDIKNPYKE